MVFSNDMMRFPFFWFVVIILWFAILIGGYLCILDGICPIFKEPAVRFPVEPGKRLSKHTMDVMKKIQEKKVKAEALTEELAKEILAHAHALDEFRKRKEELCKYMALIKGVVNLKKK